ncbi:MAG: hypothetical protein J6C53_04100 [Clostridia bacterium]|nr:hypothetical protein [Clostridia bacterium]
MLENVDITALTEEERKEWIKKIEARIAEIDKIQKAELKQQNKGRVYKLFSKIGKVLGKVFVWTTVSVCVALMALNIQAYARQNDLPASYDDISSFHQEVDVNYLYSSLQGDGSLTRLTIQKGRPVKFNILMDNLSDDEKAVLQSSIDEVNEIFKVINPDYKFELNFDANAIEKFDPYNVDVRYFANGELPEKSDVLGQYTTGKTFSNKNGAHGYGAEICIKRGHVTSGVFLHEVLHHLGLGDAYRNYYAKVASVMQTGEAHIRTNDVALLVAKYGDYSTSEKYKELVEYITHYEESQPWFEVDYKKQNEYTQNLLQILPEYGISIDDINFNIVQDGFVYGKIERQEDGKNICEIAKIGANRIQHDKYIFGNSSTTLYIKDVSTSEMNGVRFVTNGQSHEFITYFAYGNKIYRASYTNSQWQIEKAFEICSESEYDEIASIQPDYTRTVIHSGMVSMDIEIDRK